ncbi:DUF6600 domain-containing protein [Cupriavidus necator]|uniref:DUF6600 domain-containing protein n=1 Tax=Cupriavidus necator TaxID=106590 RepID=UPI00278AAE0A|nr:DUF6600 domain-containing protein [Cupriavidus necator]MDQ0139681.1 hypothetical protein [Cupriavidus necator]
MSDPFPSAGPARGRFGGRLALTALATAAGLAVAAAALAQAPAAPGEPYLDAPVADAALQQADPSARIATLTAVDGQLSFAPAGSDDWAAAGLNRPVTTGDRLWLEPGGRAELHAGTVALRMGGATAASILNLDDSATQVKLTQGTLQVRVRALPPGQTVEVDTPNLAFVPREPGDYRLDVAPDGSTTTVTLRHGSAVVYGDSRTVELRRGDRMRFAGTDLADAGGGAVPEDAFDRWTAARDAREDASQSARYVPREMPGYAALDGYGDWQEDPGYGAVWFPRVVSVGWAPYSAGHWAWIAPWGWTWIDDAPWGFAPSHYGRWAYVGSRWGWVPGPRVRPCYAPALVAFVGAGPGWNVRVGSGPGVAWYPLGPRDAYRPVYRASPTYVARINRVTVNNFVMGDRRPPLYANRNVPGAITGMPARNFVEGRPARGLHRPEWRNLPAGEARGAPPVAPVKGSLVGAAPLRPLPPQARHGFERQAIAAREPGRPATDDLARRFAREGGIVPGAGPAWRGGNERRTGRDARPVPDVRMSQAAIASRDHAPGQPRPGRVDADADGRAARNGATARDEPWRGNGRGQSTRPDEARGFAGQPGVAGGAPQQPPALQREPQRQQMEPQRALREQQRQLDEQRQQRMPPRQWADGQERPDPARQSQEMQRQRFEQQRQMQQAQQQRQMEEARQHQPDARQGQEMQRQRIEQQRQIQEGQQRQAQEQQRQQAMQHQAEQQQRQMQEQQRAMQEQQRQQVMQRQAEQQQRQMQEQQRAMHEQQRAMQEQQRQQAMQRQAEQQQRQVQDQQRAMHEQQRAMQEQQRQQAMQRQAEQQQRQAEQQQRQMHEQQRQMQEHQRQQIDQQRQQQQQQQQQQQRVQHERGQLEARQGRDGDRR